MKRMDLSSDCVSVTSKYLWMCVPGCACVCVCEFENWAVLTDRFWRDNCYYETRPKRNFLDSVTHKRKASLRRKYSPSTQKKPSSVTWVLVFLFCLSTEIQWNSAEILCVQIEITKCSVLYGIVFGEWQILFIDCDNLNSETLFSSFIFNIQVQSVEKERIKGRRRSSRNTT